MKSTMPYRGVATPEQRRLVRDVVAELGPPPDRATVGGDGARALGRRRVPRGALRRGRPLPPPLGPSVAGRRDRAAVRPLRRHRGVVGPRRRGGHRPARPDPAPRSFGRRTDRRGLDPRPRPVAAADVDHRPERRQGRDGHARCSPTPSSPASTTAASSCARASAGRCASTPRPIPTGSARSSTRTRPGCRRSRAARPSSTSGNGSSKGRPRIGPNVTITCRRAERRVATVAVGAGGNRAADGRPTTRSAAPSMGDTTEHIDPERQPRS